MNESPSPPETAAPAGDQFPALSAEGLRREAESLPLDKAIAEQAKFTDRDLDREALSGEHDRVQRLRATLNSAAIKGVWFVFGTGCLVLLCFVWNEVAPLNWQWMTNDQKSLLRTFFFSSAASGLVSAYLGPRLK